MEAICTPDTTGLEPVAKTPAPPNDLLVKIVADASLALENAGKRDDAIALLELYKEKGAEIKGTLAGQMKHLWFETELPKYGQRSLALYREPQNATQKSEQIYYLAINVAFMEFTFASDKATAQAMAKLALKHADPPGNEVWKTATVAKAYLYLDRAEESLGEQRRLVSLQAEARGATLNRRSGSARRLTWP